MLPEGARRRDRGEECQVVGRLPARGHRDASGARVYGRVNEWVHHPADEQAIDHGPLENISVIVRGASFSRDLLTDWNGR